MARTITINLALQGGGVHGALTWGVLDRLLEEETVEIAWISATSAGAINAIALAAGLAEGSRQQARACLFRVWEAVYKAGAPNLLRFNPFFADLTQSHSMTRMAALWSPYELNPLGFDPLRRVLERHIDFAGIRDRSPVELLIAATHMASGRARFFRRREMTVDAVLASACLPTVHHAVTIEGEQYWDGGFAANPDLVNLAMESPAPDTLAVLLAPVTAGAVPRTARDIARHLNWLAFNSPLARDAALISAVRNSAAGACPKGKFAGLTTHRFHVIDASPVTQTMQPDSKLKLDWTVMTYLHGAGRAAAEQWLGETRADVGHRETFDFDRHFSKADGAQSKSTATPLARASSNGRRW